MKDAVIATVQRVKRLRQRLRVVGWPHAVALMYHRIATPSADPWDLSVSPRHFAEQLSVLRDWAACRNFGDLAAALGGLDAPRRMAAVTFDDGYHDNLAAALPQLEAYDVPATVFAIVGALGDERDFWWDALARVFLTTPALPETLELCTARGRCVWRLGVGARCSAADLRMLAAARLPFDARRHPRLRVMARLRETLVEATTEEAERLCAEVCAWAGLDRSGAPADRPMTTDALSRLAASGLVEIGAHTMTHRPLDRLSPAEARAELGDSRAALRDIVGREIRTVSYPYGRFSTGTPRLAAEVGYTAAGTVAEHVAFGTTDRHRFPRIAVRDWDGDQFARILRQIAGP